MFGLASKMKFSQHPYGYTSSRSKEPMDAQALIQPWTTSCGFASLLALWHGMKKLPVQIFP
jgi:hypothetical protein